MFGRKGRGDATYVDAAGTELRLGSTRSRSAEGARVRTRRRQAFPTQGRGPLWPVRATARAVSCRGVLPYIWVPWCMGDESTTVIPVGRSSEPVDGGASSRGGRQTGERSERL